MTEADYTKLLPNKSNWELFKKTQTLYCNINCWRLIFEVGNAIGLNVREREWCGECMAKDFEAVMLKFDEYGKTSGNQVH